ncbi:hypothetical protein D9M70_485980 [compost metagenome]
MQAAADMEVDASGRRIGDIGGKQPVPGGKRRVADMRQEIGLEARDPAAGFYQRHHFEHDELRPRHVDEHQPHMGTVEGAARQAGRIGVALAHLHLGQGVAGDETARKFDEVRVALDTEHGARGPHAFAKQVQHTTGTATEIDDVFAWLDADPFELLVGIWGEIGDLSLQAFFLGPGAPKQIEIRLAHGVSPSDPGEHAPAQGGRQSGGASSLNAPVTT